MTNEIIIIVGVSFVSTCVALLFVRRILNALKVVDVPNHRSSHTQITIRGAGLALLLGLLVGTAVSFLFSPTESHMVALVLAPAILVSIVGFIEDLHGLSMKIRLLSQLVIGLLTGFLFVNQSVQPLIWVIFVSVTFAAYVNFTNFMDGVNGISAFHGVVVGLAFGIYGLTISTAWLQTVGFMIFAVFLAFIPANFRKPGMFLGDVGSYLLGGAISVTAVALLSEGTHWFVVLAPVSIYLTDTIFTIANRIRLGESITEAHRSHVYQKLNQQGFSHLQVSLTVAIFSIVVSLIGYLFLKNLLTIAMSVVLLLVMCFFYTLLPIINRKVRHG